MGTEPVNAVDGAALRGRERELYVEQMFNRIAEPYDDLNRVISMGRDQRWRRLVVDMGGIGPGQSVLDLGTGTGDLAEAARVRVGETGRVLGLDLSENMLAVARQKIARHGWSNVVVRRGNAEATEVPDASVDVVTMGWVLRNVGDRAATYREIRRVLKPGGRFVSLDMSKPESAFVRAGFHLYLRTLMPLFVRMQSGDGPAYRYLKRTTEEFLTARELAAEMRAGGFGHVDFRTLMLSTMAIHVATSA